MISEEDLRTLCAGDAVRITGHIMKRCEERDISLGQVYHALMQGEIIRQYPEGRPYPSCLLLHAADQPLHVVASASESELFIITAYYPDPAIWEPDFRHKKGTKEHE